VALQLFGYQKVILFYFNVDDENSLVVIVVDSFAFALILGLLAQPIEADAKVKPQKLGSFGLSTLFTNSTLRSTTT
jgi:hypothetical protein